MSLVLLDGFGAGLDDVEVLYPDINGGEEGITIQKSGCTLHECSGSVLLFGGCPATATDSRIFHHRGDIELLGQCSRSVVDTVGYVKGSSAGYNASWRIKAREDIGGPQPTPTNPAYKFTDCTDLWLDIELKQTTREGLVLDTCNSVAAYVKIDQCSTGTATTYDAIQLLGTGTKFSLFGQVTMPTSGNRQRYGLNVPTTCTLVHNFMAPLEGVTAGINDPGVNVTSH